MEGSSDFPDGPSKPVYGDDHELIAFTDHSGYAGATVRDMLDSNGNASPLAAPDTRRPYGVPRGKVCHQGGAADVGHHGHPVG
jgi:hypothetical protein